MGEAKLERKPVRLQSGAMVAVAEEMTMMHRYPDSTAERLRDAIARRHSVQSSQVIIDNGVDELLLLTALALGKPEAGVVVSASTYPGHANAAAAARLMFRSVPLHNQRVDVTRVADAVMPNSMSTHAIRIILVVSHSPPRSQHARGEIRKKRRYGNCDEAYIEYARTGGDRVGGPAHSGRISCAGAAHILKTVRPGRPPVRLRDWSSFAYRRNPKLKRLLIFNVNRLALAAAETSVGDTAFVTEIRDSTRALVRRCRRGSPWPWARANPQLLIF